MFELIVALDQHGGIGKNGVLPWHCPEELSIFSKKTNNNIIIVGRNTLKNLPRLINREIFLLTRSPRDIEHYTYVFNHNAKIITKLADGKLLWSDKKKFIAGGAEIYKHALSNDIWVHTIHMSIMKGTYDCDTFLDIKIFDDFVVSEKTKYNQFTHYVLKRTTCGERQYLNLINKIISYGMERNGRNGKTRSLFVENFTFNLQRGFPLITTKKMHIRGIIEEFLFFLRGDTDCNILSDKGVNIWKANTTKEFISDKNLPYAEGIMGPMYGFQWRNFNSPYILDDDKKPSPLIKKWGIDQLKNVIELIIKDPHSRRIIMTSYNPLQAEQGVLYPCHSLMIQFYVEEEYLDMFCYNRSQDTFLGVPYNIASSSLLLMVVAKLTGKLPRNLHITMGDVHLYEEHINIAKFQTTRIPYQFPTMEINNITNLESIGNLKYEDFVLSNYNSHEKIHAKMIA